jgi:tetratricopeptide (TPR) repeat protein
MSYDPEDVDISRIFIAREREIDDFTLRLERWYRLANDPNLSDGLRDEWPTPDHKIQGLVVLIYGRGGYGKSTLLRRFEEIARDYLDYEFCVGQIINWQTDLSDKERMLLNPPPGEVVDVETYYKLLRDRLAVSLKKRPDDFKEYQRAVEAVLEACERAEKALKQLSKRDDNYKFLADWGAEAIRIALRIATQGVINPSDKMKEGLSKVIQLSAAQAAEIRKYLHDKLSTKAGDYLETEERLGRGLGRDLAQMARGRPLLLLFDTYEVADEADELLRMVMGAAGKRVGWIIAGRDNLWGEQFERSERKSAVGYKELTESNRSLAINFGERDTGSFSRSEIKEFFEELSRLIPGLPAVEGDDKLEGLWEVTQGVPLAVSIAAGLYREKRDLAVILEGQVERDKIVKQMVERYLVHTDAHEEDQQALYGLALLRKADQPDKLAAALGLNEKNQDEAYNRLRYLHRRYGFIFTSGSEPALHEEVRHFMREWLLVQKKLDRRILKISRRLYDLHLARLSELEEELKDKSLRERLEEDRWWSSYLDWLEQQFWLDGNKGAQAALPLMVAAAIYRREGNDEVAGVVSFFDRQGEIVNPYLKRWKWVEASLVYRHNRNPEKKELAGLEELVRLAGQTGITFPAELAMPECRAELEAALWWRRAEAYEYQDNQKALEWYERVLTQLRQDQALREAAANAALERANDLHKGKKYNEVISILNRSLELRPDYSGAFNNRGNAYKDLKQVERAIQDYDQAINFDPNFAMAFSNRGIAYYDLKQVERAIQDFDQAINFDSNFAMAFSNRGLAYYDLKQIERAIQDFDQAINLDPNLAIAFFNRGNAYSDLKQVERAIQDFDQAINLDPNFAAAFNIRGIAYANLEQFDHAIQDYDQAINLDPNLAMSFSNRGLAYSDLKQSERAIQDYDQAINLDPNFAAAFFNRGIAYSDLKQVKRAIQDYDQAINFDPNYAAAFSNRGLAYANLEQFDHAIQDYDQAINLDPNLAIAFFNRGMAYYDLKQVERAIQDFDQAINLDPNYAIAFFNRGIAYYDLKQVERAIQDFDQAINFDSNFAIAFYKRGLAYYDLEQFERAIQDYDQAINLDPNLAIAFFNRGNAYSDLKQVERAIQDFDQAINLDPNFAAAFNIRGIAYANLEQLERAIQDFDQAIDLDPNDATAFFIRGLAYYDLEQFEQALEDYEQAIRIDPNYADVYDSRGDTYKAMGDLEAARRDFELAVELGHQDAKEKLEKLLAELESPAKATEDEAGS